VAIHNHRQPDRRDAALKPFGDLPVVRSSSCPAQIARSKIARIPARVGK
jgi:hypothetical protein